MRENPHMLDFKEDDRPIAFMDVLMKYLRYWPYFIIGCILFGVLGYYYEKYAPRSYRTVAKIKILDDAKQAKIIPNEVLLG